MGQPPLRKLTLFRWVLVPTKLQKADQIPLPFRVSTDDHATAVLEHGHITTAMITVMKDLTRIPLVMK